MSFSLNDASRMNFINQLGSDLKVSGSMQYSIVDEDGQSNGSGKGNWTLESIGGFGVFLELGVGGKTWEGEATGSSNNFNFDSNHGVYNFRR